MLYNEPRLQNIGPLFEKMQISAHHSSFIRIACYRFHTLNRDVSYIYIGLRLHDILCVCVCVKGEMLKGFLWRVNYNHFVYTLDIVYVWF